MKNLEMVQFIGIANQFLATQEVYSKLVVAVKKQTKVFSKALEDYYEKLEDARIGFASEDEKGNLITTLVKDTQQFSYTKESSIKLNAKNKELLDQEKEVEIFLDEKALTNLPEQWHMEFGELLKIEFPQPLV